MSGGYDMRPLNETEKFAIDIKVVNKANNINSIKAMPASADYTVADLKVEIANVLGIKQAYQERLLLIDDGSNTSLNEELDDESMKLSRFNLNTHCTVQLEISDDCEWTPNLQIVTKSIPPPISVRDQEEKFPEDTHRRLSSGKKFTQREQLQFEPYADQMGLLIKQSKLHCRLLIVVFVCYMHVCVRMFVCE